MSHGFFFLVFLYGSCAYASTNSMNDFFGSEIVLGFSEQPRGHRCRTQAHKPQMPQMPQIQGESILSAEKNKLFMLFKLFIDK